MAATGYALAVAVVSGAASYEIQERKAEQIQKEQEKLTGIEQAVQGEEAARSRRKQIQQAMIAQSQIENQAAASGTAGSSAPIVAGQNVTAQAGGNISDINFRVGASNAISQQRQNITNAQQPTLFESVAGSISQNVASGAAQAAGTSLFT